jgi:hypothetical protein
MRLMGELSAKPDEEIRSFIDQSIVPPGAGGHVTGRQLESYVKVIAGLTELSLHSQETLRGSIDAFKDSNDRYSKRIVRLTWALIVLTSVLVTLALPPAISECTAPRRNQAVSSPSRPPEADPLASFVRTLRWKAV